MINLPSHDEKEKDLNSVAMSVRMADAFVGSTLSNKNTVLVRLGTWKIPK
jgi:hypothetical protein